MDKNLVAFVVANLRLKSVGRKQVRILPYKSILFPLVRTGSIFFNLVIKTKQ